MKINSKNILTILIAFIMILNLGPAVIAQTGDVELSISQTLPDEIYQNDNNGRDYVAEVTNSGGIAEDLEVEIVVPAGFSLANDSLESIKVIDNSNNDEQTINSTDYNITEDSENLGTYIIKFTGENTLLNNDDNSESYFNLGDNQKIKIDYKLTTTADAGNPGDVLKVNASYLNSDNSREEYTNEEAIFVNMEFGDLKVDINYVEKNSSDEFDNPTVIKEAYRDEEVFIKVEVENIGTGHLFDTTFESSWGFGFNQASSAKIEKAVKIDSENTESNINIDSSSSDYKYLYNGDNILKAGEKYVLIYSLTVEGKNNHNPIEVSANNAVSGTEEETVFFTFRPRRPEVSITAPDSPVEISYEESKEVSVTIENAADLNHGPARDFKVYADIPTGDNGYNVMLTDSSNSNWIWNDSGGYFEYTANGGNIPQGTTVTQGTTVNLNFELQAKEPQNNSYSSPSNVYNGKDSGIINLETEYKNDEDDIFYYPVDSFDYRVVDVPVVDLDISVESRVDGNYHGDPNRVFLDEPFTFIYEVDLESPDKWEENEDITFELNIADSDYFAIDKEKDKKFNNEVGTASIDGELLTWTMTPAEAAAEPALKVYFKASDKPEDAGNEIGTFGEVSGKDILANPLSAVASYQVFLQSRDDRENDEVRFSYQSKTLVYNSENAVDEEKDGYDITRTNDNHLITYQLEYQFTDTSAGEWEGSSITDDLAFNQILNNETLNLQYKTSDTDWQPVPDTYNEIYVITKTDEEFRFSLGFLKDKFDDNNEVKNKTVEFKYTLELTHASNPKPGSNASSRGLSKTILRLNGATGGHPDPNENDIHRFYQGVYVPYSRASARSEIRIIDNDTDTDITTKNIIEKGEKVALEINLNKLRPWLIKDAIVTIDLENEDSEGYFIRDFSDANYDLKNFSVKFNSEFSNLDNVVEYKNGVIKFDFSGYNFGYNEDPGKIIITDLIKDCSDNFQVNSKLEYKDGLSDSIADYDYITSTDSDSPRRTREAGLIISAPSPVFVTDREVEFEIDVTNTNTGTAREVLLISKLHKVLEYMETINLTEDNVNVDSSFDTDGYKQITWELGDIGPGETKTLTIKAEPSGTDRIKDINDILKSKVQWHPEGEDVSEITNISRICGVYPASDLNDGYVTTHIDFKEPAPFLFIRNNVEEAFDINNKESDEDYIEIEITNNSRAKAFNIEIEQDLKDTNFEYVDDSIEVIADGQTFGSGEGVNDPTIVDDSVLKWSYDSTATNYLAALDELASRETINIRFKVRTNPEFKNNNTIKSSAKYRQPSQVNAADPDVSENYEEYLGANYRVPRNKPNISVDITGRNKTIGESDFSDPAYASKDEEVEWKIEISNDGPGPANDIVMENIFNNMDMTTPLDFKIKDENHEKVSAGLTKVSGEDNYWQIPDIAANESRVYYITGTVSDPIDGSASSEEVNVYWNNEWDADYISLPGNPTGSAELDTRPNISFEHSSDNLTRKDGTITITMTNTGAPIYNLDFDYNLSDRYKLLNSGIEYKVVSSTGSSDKTFDWSSINEEPSSNSTLDNLQWGINNRTDDNPIPAGTYEIIFGVVHNGNKLGDDPDPIPGNIVELNYDGVTNQNLSLEKKLTPKYVDLSINISPKKQIISDLANDVEWTISVKNDGNTKAINTKVEQELGDGFDYDDLSYTLDSSYRGDNFSYSFDNNNGILSWTDLEIPAGETAEIIVTTKMLADGSHTNTVQADEISTYTDDIESSTETVSAYTAAFNLNKELITDTPSSGYFASGEIVEYQVTADLIGNLNYKNLKIVDNLPEGLEVDTSINDYTNGSYQISAPNLNFNNTTDDKLEWMATIDGSSNNQIIIDYKLRVNKEGGVSRGTSVENIADASFDIDFANDNNDSNDISFNTDEAITNKAALEDKASFTFQEPELSITREAIPTEINAGTNVSHTITISNSSEENISPAYEIKIIESVPEGFRDKESNIVDTVVIEQADDTVLTEDTDYELEYDNTEHQLKITFDTVNGILNPAEEYIIEYQTEADNDIPAGNDYKFRADIAEYYSLESETNNSASYPDPNIDVKAEKTLNSTSSSFKPSVDKTKVSPGDKVTFTLDFEVPAKTTINSFDLSAQLPEGLKYISNNFNGPGTPTGINNKDLGTWEPDDSNLTGDPENGGQSIVFPDDDVTVTNDSDSVFEYSLIFEAIVLNVDSVRNNENLNSSFTYQYNSSELSDNLNLKVIEPELSLSKSFENVSGENSYESGDTVEYTITINHSGNSTADAYDLTVKDIIPDGMTYVEGSMTNNSDLNIITSTADSDNTIIWNIDEFTQNDGPVELTYQVKLDDSVEPAEVLTNRVSLTWASHPDGDNGDRRTGVKNSNLNDYFLESVSDLTINSDISITKSIIGDKDDYAIGDNVRYKVDIDLIKGTINGLSVDNLIPGGLKALSSDSFTLRDGNGVELTKADYLTDQDLSDNNLSFAEIINSGSNLIAGDRITIEYEALVENIADNQNGDKKEITTNLYYNDDAGNQQNVTANKTPITIIEPDLVLNKSFSAGNNGAGDTVDYTITINHSDNPTAAAYDLKIKDNIPDGMTYVGGSMTNNSDLNIITSTADSDNTIIWNIDEFAQNDGPVDLTYSVKINDDVRGSIELKNQLESKWYSKSADVTDRREYSDNTSVTLTTRPDLSVNDKETNINTPTITGTTNPEQKGNTVNITVDGKDYSGTVDENGDWSIEVTDEIPDGNYTVEAEINDSDTGNTTTAEGNLVIDTVKPTINVDDKKTADTTPPLTGTSDETGGTVKVTVEDNEGNKIFEGSSTVNDDGSWEIDTETEGEWTESKEEFDYGEDYKVKAEITDEAGNNSTSEGDLQIYSAEPQIDTEFTAGNETRKPGEESYFELKITNNGEIKVKDMEISIPIPDGFELNQDNIQFAGITLTSDQFEINEGVLTISLSEIEDNPDLEVGESKLIKLPGQISESGNSVEAGSNISTQAKLTYKNITDKIYQQDSNQAVIEVLTVHEITIVEPEIAFGNQGAQAIYPHTVTNAGNSLERVILSLENLDGYTADWYYDSNGNQELDKNTDQLISREASSGVEMNALSPGESEKIIVAVNIPSDAPESEKTFTINAKSNIVADVEAELNDILNIVEISPTLAVDSDPNTIEMGPDNKEYQYEGQSYKLNIDYGNTGDLAIDNPIIKIKLSEYVQEPDLVQIAANNDNINEIDLSYDSEDNIITFNADEIDPEQSESFSIELNLNEDVVQGTEIKTEVEFLQNQSGTVLLQKDHILTAANRGPNQIELTADPEVIYGDGESTSTLTATISDILGEAVEDGTEVTFRIDDPKITTDNLLPNSNYEDQTVISSSDGDVLTATVNTKNGKAKIDIKSPDISSDNPLKIPVEARANNDDTGEVSTRIYIVFSPGELKGEVIDGSTGLPEAGIEIQLWLDGLKTKTTITDEDGQYSFSIPEDGDNYEIRIIQDEEAFTIETGNFEAKADGQITLAPRAIAGKIYYENGDELDEETEIEIYKPDGERYKEDTTFMTTNKGKFYFVLPEENSGSQNTASALINKFASLFKIRAQNDSNEWTIKAPKFGIQRKVIEPISGQKSLYNNLLIPLDSGIVVDKVDNDKKIEGAEVNLINTNGIEVRDSITVSDTGKYIFEDVSPGEYYLTSEADGYYDYQEKIILQNKNNITQKIEMEKITQNDISISKESNNSSALPNEEVEYTIKIKNNKDRKLEGLEVTDTLPDKLEYIAGSVNQNGVYDSDKNQLSWTLDLDKDATLELKYQTKIVDAEIADVLENTVEAEYNGFTFDQVQNNLTVSPDLVITKTAAEEKISIGDFISYKLEISNDSQYDLNNVTVTDKLPPGFKYVQDSAVKLREDGKEEKLSPTKADRIVEWSDIELEAESSLEIRYTLVVGSGVANNKRYINKAYVRLGETVISNTADAEVLVIEDPLFTTSAVIGKVYLDQNRDGMQTEGEEEKGLEGIRILSTNGQIVETDKFGRFHFDIKAEDNIQPMQTLVLKIDIKSLPKGTEVSSSNPVIVKIREGLMSEVNFKIKYVD